jgi:flagellar assembly factor FliW
VPAVETLDFGPAEYSPEDLYHFPLGIPAFEEERSFVLIRRGEFSPFLVLQSATKPRLRFICLPLALLAPAYPLDSEEEALASLGIAQPPGNWIALAVITFAAGEPPTANLLAPIILNPSTRCGVQSLQPGSGYSARWRLPGDTACS